MRRALPAVLAALLLGPGCGGDDHETAPARVVRDALDRTLAAPSERVHVEVELSAVGLDEPVDIAGDGVLDNRTRDGRMTFDMSEALPLAGGASTAGEGIAQAITDGSAAWVRWPPLSRRAGSARPWVRVDLPASGDPARLRPAGTTVEVIGPDRVRGTATTHYRTSVASPLGESKKVPADVWIADAGGLVRKVRVRGPVNAPGAPVTVQVDATVELYDFRVSVEPVEPPPESETADLAAGAP
jgi:hypothetical protein